MKTETLDKLYLEWSQFTKAKTKRELDLEKLLHDAQFQLINGSVASRSNLQKHIRIELGYDG